MWFSPEISAQLVSVNPLGVLGILFFWIFPIPFIGALLTPILAKIHPRLRDYGAVFFSFLAALAATSLIPVVLGIGFPIPLPSWQLPWIPSLNISVGVLIDPLSVFMANIVTWLAFLIMVYSLGYMRGEASLTRYWIFMNLFLGSMLLIVMSDNLLQLFFGWEGVGLCSYQLIGFYYSDRREKWVGVPGETALGVDMAYSPSHAGMKAFIVTRIGDVFLLAGILSIALTSGTFSFIELAEHTPWAAQLAGMGLLVPVCLSIFIGAVGKSAQFPLHEWLPDAMAGPTSVSALIHAATMVKAGVYLVARMAPLFYIVLQAYGGAEIFFYSVAGIGAFTAFLAGTQALVSSEIKKVLAYSTVSQIGYMMLGLGAAGLAPQFAGGYVASLFHLMSHAIFKASLFMAAGAVIHTVESRFLDDMGSLRKVMRITYISMILGVLSLSGVPPFAGFWSKDAVLLTTWSTGNLVLFTLGVVTAGLTILYSLRMVGMVFHSPKSDHLKHLEKEKGHLHAPGKLFWVPYGILAVVSLVLGLAGPLLESSLHTFFEPLLHGISYHGGAVDQSLAIATTWTTSAIALVVGGLIGYLLYIRGSFNIHRAVKQNRILRAINKFLVNRWYMNPLFYKVFVYGTIRASQAAYKHIEVGGIDQLNVKVAPAIISGSKALYNTVEQHGFDSTNMGFANLGVKISRLADWIDVNAIDALANKIKGSGAWLSQKIRRLQTGITHQYVFALVAGLVLIILLFEPMLLFTPLVLLVIIVVLIAVVILSLR
ncbi:MAG: NADH-quinone oxidoreductase subunit L [Candidatus Hodarchaeota archaeon]